MAKTTDLVVDVQGGVVHADVLVKARRSRSHFLFFSCALLAIIARGASAADVLTERSNNSRTGSVEELNLNASSFGPGWGRLGAAQVDGPVYAQPLLVENLQMPSARAVHNTLFVATSRNNVYAFDAGTLVPLWGGRPVALGPNDKSVMGHSGCDGLSPDGNGLGIGIEATPVIDMEAKRIFVSYRTNPTRNAATVHLMLVALDVRTEPK
jgi:hypothetical protein